MAPHHPFNDTWKKERTLRDGTRVLLRPIRKDDREALRRAFQELSPEGRYRRFLSAVTEPSEETLTYLTDVDQKDHVAIVAIADSLDLKDERGVGVARYIRLRDEPGVAEAAVTVVDAMQNKGLGSILGDELAKVARANGISYFRAEVLASNEPMRQMLDRIGARTKVRAAPQGDVVVFDVSLEPSSLTVAAQILRAAATSMTDALRRLINEGTNA